MAIFNLNNYTAADGLGFPMNFRRGAPNPLDNSAVWSSLEAAKNYAATDPTAYVGQILTVVDNENNKATAYVIQDEAGNLKEIGASEGVTADVAALTETVNGLNESVQTIENDYLTSADKTALQREITSAANQAKEDAVLAIMGEAGVDEKYDTLKEIADWILSDTTNSAELITRVTNIENDYLKGADKTELQGKLDELSTLVGTLPEDAASSTVVAYIQEVVDGLNIGDYAKATELTALATRVTALEAAIDTKVDKVEGSRLITEDEATKLSKLVLGDDGTVSISGEINASNVKELDTWITQNRDDVPGLLSAVDKTKLDGIAEGAQANVLEAVAIDGSVLDIVGKQVNIPLATTTAAGVMSAVDKVALDTLGTDMVSVKERVTALEAAVEWETIE